MLDRFHPPVEEYLETIFALEEEGIPVIQARLAERLGKAAPSVSEMLDRLEADGLITRSGRRITMTPAGRSLAEGVVRKHRLAERLLVDIIGLDWDKAHVEAGRWEHVISDDVEARLVVLLDNPTTCPHGNPIPGSTPGRHHPEAPGRGPARRPRPAGPDHRERRARGRLAHLPRRQRPDPRHHRRGPVPGARRHAHPGHGDAAIALGPAMTERMFIASA